MFFTLLFQVSLTLWGTQAEEFDGSLQPVVAVKNGRINEYGGGKSVSLLQSSVFQINPDITEAHKLRGWFDNIGSTQEQENISGRTAAAGGEYLIILSAFISLHYFHMVNLLTVWRRSLFFKFLHTLYLKCE
jgi:replication factor A1